MFIYDKLIGDLPDDFYTFKSEIHKYFPIIYDTKSISSSLKKYEKTSLDSLHRTIIKNKYIEIQEKLKDYMETKKENESYKKEIPELKAQYEKKISDDKIVMRTTGSKII